MRGRVFSRLSIVYSSAPAPQYAIIHLYSSNRGMAITAAVGSVFTEFMYVYPELTIYLTLFQRADERRCAAEAGAQRHTLDIPAEVASTDSVPQIRRYWC